MTTMKATAARRARIPAAIAAADTMLRAGVRALLLRAGHRVTLTETPRRWLALHRAGLCFVDLDRVGPIAARHPAALVFAIDAGPGVECYRRVIRDGGRGIVTPDMDAATLEAIVAAAGAGCVVMPGAAARLLATRTLEPPSGFGLSGSEVGMLQALAGGKSVAEVANLVGLSGRQTRRRLRRIYDELGAANRSQALVRAARLGLVE